MAFVKYFLLIKLNSLVKQREINGQHHICTGKIDRKREVQTREKEEEDFI